MIPVFNKIKTEGTANNATAFKISLKSTAGCSYIPTGFTLIVKNNIIRFAVIEKLIQLIKKSAFCLHRRQIRIFVAPMYP